MSLSHSGFTPDTLTARLREARDRLRTLAYALPDEGWIGPYAETVNPPLWEYGHIVWFQEHWCLRLKPGTDPSTSPLFDPLLPAKRPWADWLYDSSRIPHKARWQAPLPSRAETFAYGDEVLADVNAKLRRADFEPVFLYYVELCLYHELMHIEAWWMMWQQHGYRPPAYPSLPRSGGLSSIAIAPGLVRVGSAPDQGFVFDNEKWAHEVSVDAFEIDAHPVTCAAFSQFIDDRGYTQQSLWSDAGKAWLAERGARHPLHWRCEDGGWQLRRFDRWIELPCDEPVIHVNRYEAEAYCAWRSRTLPTTAQWLRAQAMPEFQLGRCWEWTADWFTPYPRFAPDPYRDYSAPWFHTHAEVRGAGSWVTDAALARPTYRNFYLPERRDPFIGFRTARK